MTAAPADRHPEDEPDGTPAYAASLRAPGDSVRPGTAGDDGTDVPDEGPDLEPDDGGADPEAARARPAADGSRAGYDVDAVSGDTDEYRPQ